MIKFSFCLILILSICSRNSQAQTASSHSLTKALRAVYQLDYKPDSTVTTRKTAQLILRVNNDVSSFRSYRKFIFDSIYSISQDLSYQERIQRSFNASRKGGKDDFSYTIIKTIQKKLISYHDNISAVDYQYQETYNQFIWQTTSVKKNIAGHECQQAYTTFAGRVWEAWFTRDIPVSDGPYKFCGLPGLVLQVRDTHDNYVFTLLCVDTSPVSFDATVDTGVPLSAKSTAVVVSKSKFIEAKYGSDATILERIASQGNQVPESLKQNHTMMLKHRNNPLELRP